MKKHERKIFHLVEKGSHGSNLNLVFDYFIMGLILLNVVAIILESITEIYEPYHQAFRIFEIVSVIIFSAEYLLRLSVAHLTHPARNRLISMIKYATSTYGLIDLFAVLPFYLPIFFKIDLRFIRALRLIRFARILKIGHYSKSLHLLRMVILDKKTELSLTIYIVAILLVLSSILMYYIEGSAQPEQFPNILATFWWAIATLTTVGYGDVYPITGWGKVISSLIALMGIGLVALPTGVISAGFISRIEKEKEEESTVCPYCGKVIADGDTPDSN
jgi:voltage-gated potassium channel